MNTPSLFIPTYFSPISQYAAIAQSEKVVFEAEDNFQKQTYRSRCYIYGANGKQLLNVPVKQPSSKTGRKKTKDLLVENDFPWQNQHFKSLQSAYRCSPYFEFFEDDLRPIFTKKYTFLMDVNIDTFLFVTDALQINPSFSKTKEYEVVSNLQDFRPLSIAKNGYTPEVSPYVQIFDDKYGFIPNLSILDLLFMEGPNAISFLEEISIDLL
ncbi:WbqC family protein [Tenacibaculum maritimum]|uniref:WbqC family protein n=1 Tax=Tenacibaculum maritimum NCIMB 2154 TaxID=1349785 RepID=A0A2H1E9F9_9FLAO|nr:WbqC family protein [Tenacibaculum maritimum]MCD9563440.1 WbqC family protein [Tenacibaculum maritimum]MCD9564410.1 WbqC family protein [Tenacibaculum maritimum]MCD9578239.1 WbqC family protein [Tenacibaculum maritimum]MCD9582539.1 WbqC family protein [Tenacibaculum maritimum]MCD9584466.1 WbqC family protein [Tenacibaculum maritimum]